MAAPARVPEQMEKIHRLLRLSGVPEMKQVLEEAAQLSSSGPHAEAGELVLKAETISSLPSQQMTAAVAEPSIAARIAVDLANGMSHVLVRALLDLERHISTESERLSSTFAQRLDKLQSSVESLQPLHDRIDGLVQSGAAVQEKFDRLAATTASLGEAHARLDTDVAALRLQMEQLSASMSLRIEETCRRVEAHEREISAIQADASGLVAKMAMAAERLERHAAAIRTLHNSHRERTELFGQVGELLHRLNEASASSEANTL
jgi:uncharacterized protein YicC (UPF0701 family)